MKPLLLLFFAVFNLSNYAQLDKLNVESDLIHLEGKWIGKLTYLDYTSGNPYTMPADVEITKIDNYNFIYKNVYPNEPSANSIDTLKISNDGKLFNEKTIKNIIRSKNNLVIVTEIFGVDGNDKKSAILRNTYSISPKKFTIIKDVKFDGDTNFIKRHEYSFFKN